LPNRHINSKKPLHKSGAFVHGERTVGQQKQQFITLLSGIAIRYLIQAKPKPNNKKKNEES
jgi:hypothetical protein